VNNETATAQRANRQVQWISGTNQIAFTTLQESIHSEVTTETSKVYKVSHSFSRFPTSHGECIIHLSPPSERHLARHCITSQFGERTQNWKRITSSDN